MKWLMLGVSIALSVGAWRWLKWWERREDEQE